MKRPFLLVFTNLIISFQLFPPVEQERTNFNGGHSKIVGKVLFFNSKLFSFLTIREKTNFSVCHSKEMAINKKIKKVKC